MRVSTSKSAAMVLSRTPLECLVKVGKESLPQEKEFKYLRVSLVSEGTIERENGRII